MNCGLAVKFPEMGSGERILPIGQNIQAPTFFCDDPKLRLPRSVYALAEVLKRPSGVFAVEGTISESYRGAYWERLVPVHYHPSELTSGVKIDPAGQRSFMSPAMKKLGIGLHTLPLQAWGATDLWTYRQEQKIDADFRRAKRDLTRYYQRAFGMSDYQARVTAFYAVWSIGGAESWAVTGKVNRLALAILQHRPLPVVKAALAREAKIPMTTYFAAVAYPAALRCLLARQNDVDVVNDYGKTLLMEAARYNQLRTVKMLLARGVNVNAKTNAPEGYAEDYQAMPDNHGFRTALMFAASYAGLPVIKALLAAGADINARDSTGLSAYDYLEGKPRHHNRNLTENGFIIAEHELYPTR